jgi:predicted component of type VI protein secretion system
LVARSTELASRFAEGGIDARDITPANLRSFLHLAVVNGAIPGLAHLQERESTHPEMLYHVLASLAGHLTTFNTSRFHPRDVPPYRHENLGEVFSQIEKMIVELLEIGGGHPGYDVLRLIPAGPEGQWNVPVEKEALLGAAAAVILSVSSDRLTEAEVRAAPLRAA